jgi:hypothetical protein
MRAPATQAALFPELSGGNAGVSVPGDSLGLADSDISVMVLDRSPKCTRRRAALPLFCRCESPLTRTCPRTPGQWNTVGVTKLGVHDGDPLVVDLRSRPITSLDGPWDALAGPCGLPDWFGRTLDAWNDTVGTGAISAVLDAHPHLTSGCSAKASLPPTMRMESRS